MMKLLGSASVALGLMAAAAQASCIGVVTAGSGHNFWDSVISGAEAAGEELGIRVMARGPREESSDAQLQIMNGFVDAGCVGIVLAPAGGAVEARVTELVAGGMPVVYVDRDGDGDRMAVFMTDNYQAGVAAGEAMAASLNDTGQVAVFRLDPEIVSTSDRERGFLDAVQAAGLEVVHDVTLGQQIGDARQTASNAMTSVEFDGVFTPNESSSVATQAALTSTGKAGSIVHIGFDYHELFAEGLASGSMEGFMVQQPYAMGYQGVMAVSGIIEGNLPAQEMNAIAPAFVNAGNASAHLTN